MKYILAAIDGTSSLTWRKEMAEAEGTKVGESHTYLFAQEFGKGKLSKLDIRKRFWDGPNQVSNGSDSPEIRDKVIQFIDRSVRELFPPQHPIIYATRKAGDPMPQFLIEFNRKQRERKQKISSQHHLRVILIGHSRGGALAVDIARRLKERNIQVYFMGLFDAVDMSTHIEGTIITNTRYVAHAKRALSMFSRPYFVRGGMIGDQVSEAFDTSHGGVGGGLDLEPDSWSDDASCRSTVPLPAYVGSLRHDSPAYEHEMRLHQFRNSRAKRVSDRCISESERAYQWMKERALDRNLPI